MVDVEYKDVKSGAYLINESGNVWSNLTNKFMRPTKDKDGYLKLELRTNNGSHCSVRIATLVLWSFDGPPPEDMKDPTANHIDSNKLNNHISNLE